MKTMYKAIKAVYNTGGAARDAEEGGGAEELEDQPRQVRTKNFLSLFP